MMRAFIKSIAVSAWLCSIGGAAGSAVPDGGLFLGGSISGADHSVALISHDGDVAAPGAVEHPLGDGQATGRGFDFE